MLALIQRVTSAKVVVEGETVGAIGPGLLALVGIEPGDGAVQVQRIADCCSTIVSSPMPRAR